MSGKPLAANHAKVCRLIEDGWSAGQIANQMGVNPEAVYKFAARTGLKLAAAVRVPVASHQPRRMFERYADRHVSRCHLKTCDRPPVPAPHKYQKIADQLRGPYTIVFNASVYSGKREDAAYWYVNGRKIHQDELVEMAG